MAECTKVKFGSEKFANDWIDKLKKTSVRDTVPIRAYMCLHCGSWHLTSKNEKGDEEKELLREKIKVLTQQLYDEVGKTREADKRYGNLMKMINGVINVSNKDLVTVNGKHKKDIIAGANLMRELLKEVVKNFKQ